MKMLMLLSLIMIPAAANAMTKGELKAAVALADAKGLVWPEAVAPFSVHLVSLGHAGDEISKTADALYDDLMKAGVEVLYDDRDARAGEKFADSDLLGIPKRIVVGKDAVATGEFEVVNRATGEVAKVPRAQLAGV